MVYHLNRQWKIPIVGLGAVSCLFGLAFFVWVVISGQITQNIGNLLGVESIFGFLGIELIYEGLKTKIEVFEDKIIYHQSRYIFSAQWCDLQQIMPSPGALVLVFSKSTKLQGGLAYSAVNVLNLHSSLAINYYHTNENRSLIRDRIIAGLKIVDEDEIASIHALI